MKLNKPPILFFLILLKFNAVIGQNAKLEELKLRLLNAQHDTTKVITLYKLAAHSNYIGNYNQAIAYSNQSIKLGENINFKRGLAGAHNNRGISYFNKGNYPEALKNYLLALKYAKEMSMLDIISSSTMNIGIVYAVQKDYKKAFIYFNESAEILKKLDDSQSLADLYNNMGCLNNELNNYEEAITKFNLALSLHKKNGFDQGILSTFNNLGEANKKGKNYNLALSYFYKAIEIGNQIKDKNGIAYAKNKIGSILISQKKYDSAIGYTKDALQIAEEIGSLELTQESHQLLFESYNAKQNYKEALVNYINYIDHRDSILNLGNAKKILQLQMENDFNIKQNAEKLKQEAKDVLANQEKKRQKIIIFTISLCFVIVLLLSILIFNRFRITLKQKQLIEKQKEKVESQKTIIEYKNKQVLDSIYYAKRIQTAILPTISNFKNKLSNSFILYLPKDIVAGDFYWQEIINDNILFAACDCTGHGVPGAMVSVVCNNALNRAVREFNKLHPAEILDKTLEIVIENFNKSEDEIKDGMDISLCNYHVGSKILEYAGANNPLWIIRNNELIEIKANKQSIGNSENVKPFTNHSIQLLSGDCVYLSSDGYGDQFGGLIGQKKLTKKRFKQLLISLSALDIEIQSEKIASFFYEYKQNIEQVDDVLVIGFKV
jgi:tetratricopeptide (TPR) repeat protein